MMTKFFNKGLLIMTALALVISSCKVTTPYHRSADPAGNGLYRKDPLTAAAMDSGTIAMDSGTIAKDTGTIATIPWKQLFSDTLLQSLIGEGIGHNLDLGIALARIHEAEANFRQSKEAFYPSLQANADATIQRSPPASNGQVYEAYLSSAWQVDIWGKLKSARRAQLAALLQSDAYKRDVQTQLVSSIASNYYSLMAFDEQLKITLATIDNRKEDVRSTQALKDADVLTGAAVMQSQANLYSAEVTLPDIRQNIRQTENTISLLLGRDPGPISRDTLGAEQVTTDLRTGLPMQLLANRPDVQEAEFQLRYFSELTNVARTFFYPALTITGQGGVSANSISQLFNASAVFGNIVGGLTQPIFNNGLNRQRLEVAKGQEQEFLLTFQKKLLTAGQEVSNALYDYQAATDKITIRLKQLHFLEKSVEFTKELMKYNANTNYTDVLTSEQNLLAAQLNGVDDKLQQLQAVVTLYASLGGGWR